MTASGSCNGQKVWNTSAHHADFGILVARTDFDLPKHQGISYFLIDMRQPGVEVRQLKQMNGHASFNEVFMTDAVVAANDLVGGEGNGWAVAKTTLSYERRPMGGVTRSFGGMQGERRAACMTNMPKRCASPTSPIPGIPQRQGRVDLVSAAGASRPGPSDPAVRQEMARLICMSKGAMLCLGGIAAKPNASPAPTSWCRRVQSASWRPVIARQAAHVHTMISGADAMRGGAGVGARKAWWRKC